MLGAERSGVYETIYWSKAARLRRSCWSKTCASVSDSVERRTVDPHLGLRV
jgi:hypothetical protein